MSSDFALKTRFRIPRDWFVLWGVMFVIQILVYMQAWAMFPAGDDWTAPVSEIGRAHREGIWKVLTVNAWQHPMYRPFQSLVFIAVDKLPGPLWPWVTVLNHLCFGFAGAVVLAWAYALRLPKWAAGVAALVFAVHPLNVAAVASVDGFGSVLTPALAWGVALVVYLLRDKPISALALATLAMTLASGVKEYVFAAVPMCVAVVVFVYPRRWLWCGIFAVVMGGAVGMNLFCRRFLEVLDPGFLNKSATANVGPIGVVINTVGGLGVGLLPANTISIFTPGGPLKYLPAFIGVILFILVLAVGLWAAIRPGGKYASPAQAGLRSPVIGPLLIALLAAASMFPASVSKRVSEMYLLGVPMGIALLVGWASLGVASLSRPVYRQLSAAAFAIVLSMSVVAIQQKVREQATSGRLSFEIAKQLNRELPQTRVKLAILFNSGDLHRIGYYSVYRLPRNGLVVHETLDFIRPGLGDTVECLILKPAATPDLSPFDMVFQARVPDLDTLELTRLR